MKIEVFAILFLFRSYWLYSRAADSSVSLCTPSSEPKACSYTILLLFVVVRVWRCCIQVSNCCAVADVLINVDIWLEWFCCLVFALLPFYVRLKYPNHKRCTGVPVTPVPCVVYSKCGRAMRIDSVLLCCCHPLRHAVWAEGNCPRRF